MFSEFYTYPDDGYSPTDFDFLLLGIDAIRNLRGNIPSANIYGITIMMYNMFAKYESNSDEEHA